MFPGINASPHHERSTNWLTAGKVIKWIAISVAVAVLIAGLVLMTNEIGSLGMNGEIKHVFRSIVGWGMLSAVVLGFVSAYGYAKHDKEVREFNY